MTQGREPGPRRPNVSGVWARSVFGWHVAFYSLMAVGAVRLLVSIDLESWQRWLGWLLLGLLTATYAILIGLPSLNNFRIGDLNASIVGNLNNLFDTAYIADATDGASFDYNTATVYYGFGRTWSMSFKLRF